MKNPRLFDKPVRMAAIALAVGMFATSVLAVGVMDGEENDDGITNVARTPTLTGKSKIILTVDQLGNLSSTNAIATSADLASVAASNQYAIAVQEATYEGYQTATNLLDAVAASIGNTPIVFCDPELTSFTAGVSQEEFDTKFCLTKFSPTGVADAYKSINGTNVLCTCFTLGYALLDSSISISPYYEYKEHIGSASSEWEDGDNYCYIGAETLVGSYTNTSTLTVYEYAYEVPIWFPSVKTDGFIRLVSQGSAASSGETLDIAGVNGGYTGVITYGNVTLNVAGGYIMSSGTGTDL